MNQFSKLREIYILPLLSFLYIFSSFLSLNIELISPLEIQKTILYLVTLSVAALLFMKLLSKFAPEKSLFRMASGLALAILVFFNFDNVAALLLNLLSKLNVSFSITAGFALILMLFTLLAAYLGKFKGFRTLLIIFLGTASLVSIATSTWSLIASTNSNSDQGAAYNEFVAVRTPNVYLFVPDAYSSTRVLSEISGFDNTPFEKKLQNLDFIINPQGHSNYTTTFLSTASLLSLSYLATEDTPEFSSQKEFIDRIVGHSKVLNTFKNNGYKYAASTIKISGAGCRGLEDVCLDSFASNFIGELEWALLRKTPLYNVIDKLMAMGGLATLVDMKGKVLALDEGPFFTFVHSLPPHPPYHLNKFCESQSQINPELLDNWKKKSLNLYIEALQCVNTQAEDLMQSIIAKDPTAIIIFQADHGSAFNVVFTDSADAWTNEATLERLSIFSAIRVPEECKKYVPESFSSVNTFSIVFSCLSGSALPLLEDKYYISSYIEADDFGRVRDVTDHIASQIDR